MSAGSARPVWEQPTQNAQLALADDLGPITSASGADMTIGEVLVRLRADFPELTISKIRYYERQGLLAPARSAAGYRKFTPADVRRLHYVLTAARDQYLPLKVIKERLAAADATALPSGTAAAPMDLPSAMQASAAGAVLPPHREPVASPGSISPDLFRFAPDQRRLSRRELLRESGLDDEQLGELEAYGLITSRGTGPSATYESQALSVARIVAELSEYGFQARHLRPVKAAVDREVGLIEQVLTPRLRQASRESRAEAEEHARGYAALSVRLHVALLEAALRTVLH